MNVCVLATDHNITKAYLSQLYEDGLQPSRVLYVNLSKQLPHLNLSFRFKRKIKDILKTILGRKKVVHIKNQMDSALDYYLPLFNDFLRSQKMCSIDLRVPTRELLAKLNISYHELHVSSINDKELIDYIKNNVSEEYILFCGGGLLKSAMFNTGKKFIHVHPGVVPDVKGADCLLWSVLLKNEIGMSVFFMNKGIDTGEVIQTQSYSIPKLLNAEQVSHIDMLPQILINYLDPSYRAALLVSAFKNNIDPEKWLVKKQNQEEGEYYHFMHPRIAQVAVRKFFK